MKYICKRCGLQRDDRRGSGCKDIKGQAHDWIETWAYYSRQGKVKWQEWLKTDEGQQFEKEQPYIVEQVGWHIK
jgi:hypothetical protein